MRTVTTRRAARELNEPRAGTQRAKILELIREATADPDMRGLADFELCDKTGWDGNTVRPRRIELVEAGLVEEVPHEVVTTHTGADAVLWQAVDVTNPSKAKGDEGEREAQALLRELLGDERIRRALGAGRKDDMGDIDGVPQTAVQVFKGKHWAPAITQKLPEVEQQRKNKRVRFASLWVRRLNNKVPWIVVMTPEQWCRMYKYAMVGVALEREQKAAKMSTHDTRRHRAGP